MTNDEKDRLIGQLLQELVEAESREFPPDNEPENEYSAFSAKIYLKDNSLRGGCGFNEALIKTFGQKAEDWYNETAELIVPILKEQAEKFNQIMMEETGLHPKSVEDNPLHTCREMMEDDE